MLTLACLAAYALATKVIEIPSPEGIRFPLDSHLDTVFYTDKIMMRLREHRKAYDSRSKPLKAS